ncbi:MAG TPA: transketolase C-terminal domain-containing protein [Mycobacteriales bacterium]|nr:transketolase C-terminal domain-containing protein [Mycobacteriales bacterium]
MQDELDRHFLDRLARLEVGELQPSRRPTGPYADRSSRSASYTGSQLWQLFEAQATSRHLDFAARALKSTGRSFYTIGSAGHEGNAAVAAELQPTDPALLHYRSGAFFLQRAAQLSYQDGPRDVLLGVVAAAAEPIAGGRHKVIGNAALNVIPQTSTIASHLPRSLGVAFAIERARKLGVESPWPGDAIAVCSFGDASANHSTAAGAINAACHVSHQGLPLPLLFVCEDNGLGISVRTQPEWINTAYGHRDQLRYFGADGCSLDAMATTAEAVHYVRERRRPAFLHLSMVRYLGHAGSDAEVAYRPPAHIAADLDRDPLLGTAGSILRLDGVSVEDIAARYEAIRERVAALAEEVAALPQLDSAAAVVAPLAPRHPEAVATAVGTPKDHSAELTLAQSINMTLEDLLTERQDLLVFGEDVARKGGVYGVTRGLLKKFGAARVFDTLLDEQSILGLALGAGISGLIPIPEIQYLAYLHNAGDQLRGEAATLQFFSSGQYRNPMVVRIAGYGYQKGFGGHFHNDNSIAALLDIPGLVIASPARPDDAAPMLRSCVAAADVDGSVCVFLEPIALYHTRDLHTEGDNGWLAAPSAEHVPLGAGRTYGAGKDLTLVTFGNGVPMSLRVANRLGREGIRARVLDLRWLAPLPLSDLLREAKATGRVLVVDETRKTGGVAETVLAALIDSGYTGRMARVSGDDSFIPLGDAALHVLLSEETIEEAARRLLS